MPQDNGASPEKFLCRERRRSRNYGDTGNLRGLGALCG
jgi:hypothetical protein